MSGLRLQRFYGAADASSGMAGALTQAAPVPFDTDFWAQWRADLARLVAQKSVADEGAGRVGAPFGPGIRAAFELFAQIAERLGFYVNDCDGYAIDARMGPGSEDDAQPYIAVLGHLDTVDAKSDGWLSEPFCLSERDGLLYGRGVNDDKGPLLLALYAAWLVQKSGAVFLRPLRVIAGGAEETSWACVRHYFERQALPLMAFSPDANFPLVNHELGILDIALDFPPLDASLGLKALSSPAPEHLVCSELNALWTPPSDGAASWRKNTLTGHSALSRHPEHGLNALDLFVTELLHGGSREQAELLLAQGLLAFYRALLYKAPDEPLSCGLCPATEVLKPEDRPYFSQCATAVQADCETATLFVDLRYPYPIQEGELLAHITALAESYGGKLRVLRDLAPLYCPADSPLLKKLAAAYESVIGEKPACLTKGGASYARALPNALAFGPSFPEDRPRSHEANECLSLDSAQKALAIYCEAIKRLCCEA